MKTIKEMTREERKEFAELLNNWLKMYTGEVLKKVAPRFNEISQNEMAMHLLRELKERDDKEDKEEFKSIEYIVESEVYEYEVGDLHYECYHNHCLTNAKSYRDVLYDLYIRR